MSRLSRHAAVVLLLAALALSSFPVAPAEAGAVYSSDQIRVRQLVNDTRGNNNRRLLTLNKDFSNKATLWARELARCRCLKHRNAPYGAPNGWYAAAENVGRGWSMAQVHQAFLGSSGHRANILNRRMTHIGVGVAQSSNGEYFVVQAFMDRSP